MITVNYLVLISFIKGYIEKWLVNENEYLRFENQILRSKLGKRIPLRISEKRELAIRGKEIGRSSLSDLASIAKADTILKWWRILVKKKWTYPNKNKTGRPYVMKRIQDLVLQFATENPLWGSRKIKGCINLLGQNVSHQTVINILKRNGIDPKHRSGKGKTWESFTKAHLNVLWATDFFTYEVLTLFGPVTHYVLFFIHLETRKVHLGGITIHPNGQWMKQVARSITDPFNPPLGNAKLLIMDRDTKYTSEFRKYLSNFAIESIRLPIMSPNLNAFAERFVRSIKEECLNHMILWNWRSLDHVVREYIKFHNHERCHQGLGNVIPIPDPRARNRSGEIIKQTRLGGLLNFYHHEAS